MTETSNPQCSAEDYRDAMRYLRQENQRLTALIEVQHYVACRYRVTVGREPCDCTANTPNLEAWENEDGFFDYGKNAREGLAKQK